MVKVFCAMDRRLGMRTVQLQDGNTAFQVLTTGSLSLFTLMGNSKVLAISGMTNGMVSIFLGTPMAE
jgi:hypothetical protein